MRPPKVNPSVFQQSKLLRPQPSSTLLRACLLSLCLASPSAHAGFTLMPLASFNGTNGANPFAGLVQGQDGNFYGTTIAGGALNLGTVYRITTGGLLTNLISFATTNGAQPRGGLVQGPNGDGYLYGTTSTGGTSNLGTVFKITTNGLHFPLFSFAGTNGANPQSGLLLGPAGTFYGTTYYGGTNNWPNGYGTVFQITTNGALLSAVSFNNTDGAEPFAGLVLGADGNFYGTTQVGGTEASGAVFRATAGGLLTNLTSFHGTNGAFPLGGLARATDGNLYGTTYSGGASNLGTVFRLTTNGALTTLISFAGTNGANPYGGLIQAADGNLYGTTEQGYGPGGDTNGYGTVFQLTTNGILTTLVSFNSDNGAYPLASLLQAPDGSFYGTTANGGTDGYGTVFRLTTTLPPAPVLRIATQDKTTIKLSWTATVGQTYQTQYRTNLNQIGWNPLGGSMTATNVTATLVDSVQSDLRRFYRLVLLP